MLDLVWRQFLPLLHLFHSLEIVREVCLCWLALFFNLLGLLNLPWRLGVLFLFGLAAWDLGAWLVEQGLLNIGSLSSFRRLWVLDDFVALQRRRVP